MRDLLDTLGNQLLMREIVFPYEKIKGIRVNLDQEKLSRDLPRLKAIKIKPKETQFWKFWVIMILVFLVGIIRILNIKRFEEVISWTFDLSINFKSLFDKYANHVFTAISLFLVFIGSFSLFMVSFLEKSKRYDADNFMLLFFYILGALLVFYLAKVLLNLIIGAIFNISGMAYMVIFNALFINNFLGILLIIFTLLFIYVPGANAFNFFTGLSILVIIVAIVYRMIKNILMAPDVTKYPFIYLFLYLCAFEFFPWLVVFKLFLNSW